MQEHPEKTDLRDQLIAYVLGESDFSAQDLEELLNNIFSPILKQEIMITGTGFLAVAARETAAANAIAQQERLAAQKERVLAEKEREAAKKARAANEKIKREALQKQIRTVMRSWNRGATSEFIIDVVELSPQKITELIAAFEKVKTYCSTKPVTDMKELRKISGLKDVELKPLLALLQQKTA